MPLAAAPRPPRLIFYAHLSSADRPCSLLLLPESRDREDAAEPAFRISGGRARETGQAGSRADVRRLQGEAGAQPVRRGHRQAVVTGERQAEPALVVRDRRRRERE